MSGVDAAGDAPQRPKARHTTVFLCLCLSRRCIEFLRKLSLFEDSIAVMAEHGVLDALVPLLSITTEDLALHHDGDQQQPQRQRRRPLPLLSAALRLLFNLSFEPVLRHQMVVCSDDDLIQATDKVVQLVDIYISPPPSPPVLSRLFFGRRASPASSSFAPMSSPTASGGATGTSTRCSWSPCA